MKLWCLLVGVGFMRAGLLPAPALQAQSAKAPPPTNVWAAQTELRGITLVWTRAIRAEGYRIYPVGTTPSRGLPAGITGKTVDHLSIILVPGYSGSYSYKIAAAYRNGVLSRKVQSNTVVPVLKRPPGTISPPNSVTASETSSGVVTVSWMPVTGATGYFIGRSVSPGGFKTVCQVCSTETSYIDRKVTTGAKHIYVVAALTPTGPTRRTRSNEVIPTANGDGGAGSTGDSSSTAVPDTLLPQGIRLFTAQQPGQGFGRVKLAWSADPRAARYLIAFVDEGDDVQYESQELFAERTLYKGSDTTTVIEAPGAFSRTKYAIVSENSHGTSELRYSTRVTGPIPADSTPSDSASEAPEGVGSLRVTFIPFPGGATAHLTWSVAPRATTYHIARSEGSDQWTEFSIKRGSDTTESVAFTPRNPMEEYRFQVVSEDASGRKSPPRIVSGIPGVIKDSAGTDTTPGIAPQGMMAPLTATFQPVGEVGVFQLRWSPDPRATRYRLGISEAMVPFVESSAVISGTDSTTSVSIKPQWGPGASFRFQLIAENPYGRSRPTISNIVSGRRPDGVARVDVPAGFQTGSWSVGCGTRPDWTTASCVRRTAECFTNLSASAERRRPTPTDR